MSLIFLTEISKKTTLSSIYKITKNQYNRILFNTKFLNLNKALIYIYINIYIYIFFFFLTKSTHKLLSNYIK
jgi:hypothetical protein